jgi:cell division protein FtsN
LCLIVAVLAALAWAQPAPAQQGAGRFVVQVGAYAGPRAAAPLVGELTRRGFPAVIVPGGDYFRVVVGPFASEAEANSALARLQQLGYQGYIRSDLPVPQASQAAPPRTAPPAAPPRAAEPAAAPGRPRPAPAASLSAAPAWVVQVGAFDGLQSAAPLTDELLRRGFPAIVVPGDDYQRVVVGPFARESEAALALSGLQQQGYQGYVRSDLRVPAQAPVVAQAEPAGPPPTAVSPPEQASPAPAEPEPPAPAPQPEPAQVAEATPPPAAPTPAPTREVEIPGTPAVPPQQTQAEPAATPRPAPEPEPAVAAPVAEPPAAQPAEPETPAVAEAPRPGAARVSEPQQQATLLPPEPPPAPEPQRPRAGSSLRLLVLAGQDAINNIKQRTARDPVVQVVDENNRPVAGAAVLFALPDRGASGTFANGARSVTMMTDAQGKATAVGFTPNAVEGDVPIQVTASYQGQTTSAVILQSNVVAAGAGISAATIGIIGAVAAGAAVAAALALGGGDSSPAPPAARPSGTATVNTGGVTIGAPSP